jgi:hypothetical protein
LGLSVNDKILLVSRSSLAGFIPITMFFEHRSSSVGVGCLDSFLRLAIWRRPSLLVDSVRHPAAKQQSDSGIRANLRVVPAAPI